MPTGKYEQMEAAYRTMMNTNVSPNHITYSTIIQTFVRSGRIDKAMYYFQEMRERMQPGEKLYIELINYLKRYERKRERVLLKQELNAMKKKMASTANEDDDDNDYTYRE